MMAANINNHLVNLELRNSGTKSNTLLVAARFILFIADGVGEFMTCLEFDPCLWINEHKGIVCLAYVDDCFFFGKDKDKINEIIKDHSKGYTPNQRRFCHSLIGY
jgi:hypothetical protein